MVVNILFDTSFLLPSTGINITNQVVIKCIKKLRSDRLAYKIFYSEINILELTWVYLREIKKPSVLKNHESIFQMGVESIESQFKKINITSNNFFEAIALKNLGHKDFLDCLLFSIAKSNQFYFLSIDNNFKEFLEDNKVDDYFFLDGNDFLNK